MAANMTPHAGHTGLDFSDDQSYALDTCARCGFCKVVCPTYPFGNGFEAYSPRAKVHFLRELREGRATLTPQWVDRLYQCTSCERCASVCQTMIPLVHLWEKIRAESVEQGLGPMPAHKKLRAFVEQYNNPYGAAAEDQALWMLPHHAPVERAELMVFGGCTASYRMPPMLRTGASILQLSEVPYVYAAGLEVCCGSPFLRTGQREAASRLIARNMDIVAEKGVSRVVTPCGGCSKTLKHDYPKFAKKLGKKWDVQVLHFSEIYVALLKEGKIKPVKAIEKTVTYHDPCHVGRSQGIFEEPRAILAAIPGLTLIEMEYCRKDSRCCGAGGGVKANYPEMAAEIAKNRVRDALETGAEMLVTMCPFCQASFTQAIKDLDAPLALAGVEELLLQSITP